MTCIFSIEVAADKATPPYGPLGLLVPPFVHGCPAIALRHVLRKDQDLASFLIRAQ